MTQPPPDRPVAEPQPEYVEHVSRFNAPVAVLAVVAAVLGVLALFVLRWYRDFDGAPGSGTHTKFHELHDALDGAQSNDAVSYGISPTYFSWLGYVLVAVAVVGALVCAARPLRALRAVTAVVAVAGVGLTLSAIQLYRFHPQARRYTDYVPAPPSGYGDWLKHTSFGAWAVLLAFVLCLVAALLPARRQRSRGY